MQLNKMAVVQGSHHGQGEGCVITARFLGKLLTEAIDGGNSNIKGEDFKDQMLHPQNLLCLVGVVSNIHELTHLWRVDFLVFPEVERFESASEVTQWLADTLGTYEARNKLAAPTSCSFPLRTDIWERNRSM